MMEPDQIRNVIEACLLVAGRPMSVAQLEALFAEDEDRPDRAAIRDALAALAAEHEGRGIELVEVAGGWRLQTRKTMEHWVARLFIERPPRYSRALLETLVLIAYRQPITRGEIEEVRGVAVSSNIVRTLQDRQWVREVGHKDVPGKPALLGTTSEFLDYFNLKRLDDLPALGEATDLDGIEAVLAAELGVVDGGEAANDGDGAASGDGSVPTATVGAQADDPATPPDDDGTDDGGSPGDRTASPESAAAVVDATATSDDEPAPGLVDGEHERGGAEEPGEVEGLGEVEESGEVEGLGAVEESGEAEGLGEMKEPGEAEGLGEAEEIGEVEGLGEAEEIGEMSEAVEAAGVGEANESDEDVGDVSMVEAVETGPGENVDGNVEAGESGGEEDTVDEAVAAGAAGAGAGAGAVEGVESVRAIEGEQADESVGVGVGESDGERTVGQDIDIDLAEAGAIVGSGEVDGGATTVRTEAIDHAVDVGERDEGGEGERAEVLETGEIEPIEETGETGETGESVAGIESGEVDGQANAGERVESGEHDEEAVVDAGEAADAVRPAEGGDGDESRDVDARIIEASESDVRMVAPHAPTRSSHDAPDTDRTDTVSAISVGDDAPAARTAVDEMSADGALADDVLVDEMPTDVMPAADVPDEEPSVSAEVESIDPDGAQARMYRRIDEFANEHRREIEARETFEQGSATSRIDPAAGERSVDGEERSRGRVDPPGRYPGGRPDGHVAPTGRVSADDRPHTADAVDVPNVAGIAGVRSEVESIATNADPDSTGAGFVTGAKTGAEVAVLEADAGTTPDDLSSVASGTASSIAPNAVPDGTSGVTSEITSGVSPDAAADTTSSVAPNAVSNGMSDVAPELASGVVPNGMSSVAPSAVPNGISDVAPEAASGVAPNGMSDVAPEVASSIAADDARAGGQDDESGGERGVSRAEDPPERSDPVP